MNCVPGEKLPVAREESFVGRAINFRFVPFPHPFDECDTPLAPCYTLPRECRREKLFPKKCSWRTRGGRPNRRTGETETEVEKMAAKRRESLTSATSIHAAHLSRRDLPEISNSLIVFLHGLSKASETRARRRSTTNLPALFVKYLAN